MLVPFGCLLNLYYKANMCTSPCKNCENCDCDSPKSSLDTAPAVGTPAAAFREYLATNPSNLEARIYDV